MRHLAMASSKHLSHLRFRYQLVIHWKAAQLNLHRVLNPLGLPRRAPIFLLLNVIWCVLCLRLGLYVYLSRDSDTSFNPKGLPEEKPLPLSPIRRLFLATFIWVGIGRFYALRIAVLWMGAEVRHRAKPGRRRQFLTFREKSCARNKVLCSADKTSAIISFKWHNG